jgi:hypothetical protein
VNHWTKRFFAVAAPLLLTGCLWGPGKFTSDLTLRKDGSFTLDYRGEIVLQIPDAGRAKPWNAEMAHCYERGKSVGAGVGTAVVIAPPSPPKPTPCTAAEIATQKAEHDKAAAETQKRTEEAARMYGLPGLDDASNRAFAAKLMKFAGWRSVVYRGNGTFDVDYHFAGRATQDFLFPALPDNDLIIPFIAIRRRSDGSVLVNAPEFVGGVGPLGTRAALAADSMKGAPVSRAQGRFTVITDGEILTNNSEDGPTPHPLGHQLHWDVGPASNKIPETLIRL